MDERVFQHGYTGIGAGQQMVQQVQVPAQVVPAISTPNGSFLVAQLLPTNAQLSQCYYVFNQQVKRARNDTFLEEVPLLADYFETENHNRPTKVLHLYFVELDMKNNLE